MARRLKVAVVGASMSNSPDGRERFAIRAHLPALIALSDLYEVVAVCTTNIETARNTVGHFGVGRPFDSVARMLREMPDIDVVCVSVRPVVHHQVVMAALAAGKHVYCEQPFGISIDQAQEMYELARAQGVRTVIGHQNHYEPAALQMAAMVKQGYIGTPLSFNIVYFVSSYIAPRPTHRQWLFQSEMGGHPAYRTGHEFDRIMSVLGADVTDICADMDVLVAERPNLDGGAALRSNQVDNMNFLMRVNGKVMGSLHSCHTAWFGSGARFEVYGTEGMLMLVVEDSGEKNTVKGDPKHGELKLYGAHVDRAQLMANPTAPELLARRYSEIEPAAEHYYVSGFDPGRATFAVAQMWHAFAHAITEGRECAPSFRDELKTHCVWDATEKAVRDKRWIKVDYSRLDAGQKRV